MPSTNRRNIVIDPDVAEKLKAEAVRQRRPMSRLVNDALRTIWEQEADDAAKREAERNGSN
jgi:hypothetical protein